MELIEREMFYVCGYAAETDAAHNADDLAKLYADFFENNRADLLCKLNGSKKGFYGLMWYTQGHEKYRYLLGVQVDGGCTPPAGSLLKAVPKTTYAVARYPQEKDAIEAWGAFFYTDIPGAGYAPDEQLNLYFEFFPESVEGDYELWVPVIRAGA